MTDAGNHSSEPAGRPTEPEASSEPAGEDRPRPLVGGRGKRALARFNECDLMHEVGLHLLLDGTSSFGRLSVRPGEGPAHRQVR
jgi:hypothetical protein